MAELASTASGRLPGRLATLGLGLWLCGAQLNELVTEVGVGICLLAVALGFRALRFEPRLHAPVLAFVAWGLLVAPLLGAAPTGTGAARLTDWLALPVASMAAGLVARAGQRRGIVIAVAVTMLASCFAAMLQHFGWWPQPSAFAGLEWTRLGFERVRELAPGTTDRFMAGGLAFHRLRFANATTLVALALFVLSAHASGRDAWLLRLAAAVGLSSVVAFPYARAATAAALAAFGLALLLTIARPTRALIAIGLAILCVVGFVLASDSWRTRMLSSFSAQGSGERAGLMAAGVAAVRAHPITGVGAGRFRPSLFAPADAPRQVLEHPGKSHNQLLSLAAELGLVGLGLWLWALITYARRYWTSSPRGVLGLVTLAGLLGLCVLHDPLFHAEVSLLVVGLLGLALSPRER